MEVIKIAKLVRDLIPEIIIKKGGKASYYQASSEEVMAFLKEKLQEEVNEFLEDESLEELADILEVLDAIYKEMKINKDELLKIKDKKKTERGAFDKKYILT